MDVLARIEIYIKKLVRFSVALYHKSVETIVRKTFLQHMGGWWSDPYLQYKQPIELALIEFYKF